MDLHLHYSLFFFFFDRVVSDRLRRPQLNPTMRLLPGNSILPRHIKVYALKDVLTKRSM